MELEQAIKLIAPASHRYRRISSWADLGCGSGLFTQALARLLPEGSMIHGVDSDKQKLQGLQPFEGVGLGKIIADFVHDPLPLADLDGILMANALHFVKDKPAVLRKAFQWLKEDGCFVLVEYDTDNRDPWVPYPLSYSSATALFAKYGYKAVKLGTQASIYKRSGIYASLFER